MHFAVAVALNSIQGNIVAIVRCMQQCLKVVL